MKVSNLRTWLASGVAVLALSGMAEPPTAETVKNIVLVHGSWVDGSGWQPVYKILTRDGYHVSMVQEPLVSLEGDVAATRRIIDLQDGPVILVGHSYGGSVITEAGNDPKVVGLVYIAAHEPDTGETEASNGKRYPSVTSKLHAIETTQDGFTYLNPADFPADFAPDLPLAQAQFEAASQIPTAAQIFKTPVTNPAWKSKPSWALVAGSDKIINPDLERFYADRAHSHVVTVDGASHSVYESHPVEVAALIAQAAQHAESPAPAQ